MAIIQDTTNLTIRAALGRRLERQHLLASNLANLDTPDYQPKDLAFEGALRRVVRAPDEGTHVNVRRTDPRHMPEMATADRVALAQPDEVVERPDVVDTLDGNGVDLDREMVRYTDNAQKFRASTEMMRRRYATLNAAIADMRDA